MPAYVATKYLDEEIGSPADHKRDIPEILRCIHKATHHNNSRHAVQVIIVGAFSALTLL